MDSAPYATLGCVLVADDEETFRSATAALLSCSGYTCEVAGDASEALHVLRTMPVEALIADLKMPGNEDLAFLRETRSAFPLLPAIVVTGYPSVPTAVDALRLAAVDYLTKPFENDELLGTLRRAISRGRAARAAQRLLHDLGAYVELAAVDDSLALQLADHNGAPESSRPASSQIPQIFPNLSTREREIFEWVARGRRVAAIAGALRISSHTVRNHLKSIFRKLGVHSQVELLGRLR